MSKNKAKAKLKRKLAYAGIALASSCITTNDKVLDHKSGENVITKDKVLDHKSEKSVLRDGFLRDLDINDPEVLKELALLKNSTKNDKRTALIHLKRKTDDEIKDLNLPKKKEEKKDLEKQKRKVVRGRRNYMISLVTGILGGAVLIPVFFLPPIGTLLAFAGWFVLCPILTIVGTIGSIVWWSRQKGEDEIKTLSGRIKEIEEEKTKFEDRKKQCDLLVAEMK